jgi:hypothetical protein
MSLLAMMRYAAYLSFENARPRTGHFGKQVPSGPVSTERRMGSRRSGSPSAVQSHRQHQSRSLAIVWRQRHLLLWHAGTTKPPVMTTTTPVSGTPVPLTLAATLCRREVSPLLIFSIATIFGSRRIRQTRRRFCRQASHPSMFSTTPASRATLAL